MRIDNANLQGTANLRKTISMVKSNGLNGLMLLADGKPHAVRGNNITPYLVGTAQGQPGANGVTGMFAIPTPPAESGSIADIGSYGYQGYILYANGNLYTCGENAHGQLGVGDTTARNVYTLATTGVTRVFTNPSNWDRDWNYAKLIIQKTDGKIYGCGYNGLGALGLGDTTNRNSFTELAWCGTNPMSVWNMGAWLGCVVCQKSDGSVFVAGYNGFGQLGNNTTTNITTAANLTTNWLGGTYAATGMVIQRVMGGFGYHTSTGNNDCAMSMWMESTTASRIASAGSNFNGHFGTGNNTNSYVPVTPITITGRFSDVQRGGDVYGSMFVLRTDGTVWNWGRGNEGQLGRNNTTSDNAPQQVTTEVTRMLLGGYRTYVYGYLSPSPILEKADGYYIAGYNVYGTLGVGDKTQRNVFTRMLFPGGTRLAHVGAFTSEGDAHIRVAVDTDNNFYAWGENGNYGVVDGNSADFTVPTQLYPPALVK